MPNIFEFFLPYALAEPLEAEIEEWLDIADVKFNDNLHDEQQGD